MTTGGHAAEVIPFRSIRKTSESDESTTGVYLESRKTPEPVTGLVDLLDAAGTSLRVSQEGLSIGAKGLSQRDLYPIRQAFSVEHITALRLLSLANGRLQRALAAHVSGDLLGADLEVQQVQVLLPELFCCRALGDGFGMVINAVLSAFESLSGDPLNSMQLRTLSSVLELLKDKLFLSTSQADVEIDKLIAVELNPYPPEFAHFLSCDESIR